MATVSPLLAVTYLVIVDRLTRIVPWTKTGLVFNKLEALGFLVFVLALIAGGMVPAMALGASLYSLATQSDFVAVLRSPSGRPGTLVDPLTTLGKCVVFGLPIDFFLLLVIGWLSGVITLRGSDGDKSS